MEVYKLKQEMVGQKVTCKIHGKLVTEGVLGFASNHFYIAQNIKQGMDADERYGFKKTWGIDGDNLKYSPNGITDFKLIDSEPNYEIY